MSTGLKIRLKIGGAAVTPGPGAAPSDASGGIGAAPQRAPSAAGPAAASEGEQHKAKKKKKKRRRDEEGRPAHPSGGQGVSASQGAGPSSAARPATAASEQSRGPIKITLKGFSQPATGSAAPAAQLHGGTATDQQPRQKKRKKDRDGGSSMGLTAANSAHAPLPKLRLKSSSGGWDQQLAAAAAAAAVEAAQHGRPGPGGFGSPGAEGAKGSGLKPKKKKPAGSGGLPVEPRKPPPRKRKASARSEGRDKGDGYEPASPDPLRQPGARGFGPPPKVAAGSAAAARPASSVGRAASSQDQGISGHAEPEAVSAPPPGPEIPPKPTDIERVMDKVQKRDVFQIFKEPVTDAVAPGYSAAIKRPMDFATMRKRHAEGVYTEWDTLQEDMRTMFNNAMTFNPPETLYHKQANTLLALADKLIGLGRRGIKDSRGRTASIVRAGNAELAAEAKVEADKARAAGRAQKAAVQHKKLAQRAAASGVHIDGEGKRAVGRPAAQMQPPVEVDETIRNYYPKRPFQTDAAVIAMKGLACGANAEGTPFGRLALAPLPGANSSTSYMTHLSAFITNLKGKAQAYLRQQLHGPPRPITPQQPAPAPQQQPVAAQQQPQRQLGQVQQQPVQMQQIRPPGMAIPAPQQPAAQAQQIQQPQLQHTVQQPQQQQRQQPPAGQPLPAALAPPGVPSASAAPVAGGFAARPPIALPSAKPPPG